MSNTFTANSTIIGKVYFPRFVIPISLVLAGMFIFVIQLAMLIVIMIGYTISRHHFNLGVTFVATLFLLVQAGLCGNTEGKLVVNIVLLLVGVFFFSRNEKTYGYGVKNGRYSN